MTDHALQRKIDAQARRDAITACALCDDEGWISGRQRLPSGQTSEAAWRCDHTDKPLPAGFTPNPT